MISKYAPDARSAAAAGQPGLLPAQGLVAGSKPDPAWVPAAGRGSTSFPDGLHRRGKRMSPRGSGPCWQAAARRRSPICQNKQQDVSIFDVLYHQWFQVIWAWKISSQISRHCLNTFWEKARTHTLGYLRVDSTTAYHPVEPFGWASMQSAEKRRYQGPNRSRHSVTLDPSLSPASCAARHAKKTQGS